jgi:hypothetical protein
MDQAAHSYLIFETAAGFCGIAWNSVGVTRFQLPTRSPEATKRILLRRAPGAKLGAPTPEVAEAIAAVKRYFEGEQTDFSGVRLDLGGQDPASHGVAFRSFTEEHLSTENELVRNILLATLSSLAKLEREKISQRTKAGLERARAKGEVLGRPKFSDGDRDKLIAALATGDSWHAVSGRTQIPYSTVKKHARALGREPRRRIVSSIAETQ